uniref:Uncharacterized protein n=1 Tax=Arundo donax TaxID=35708 RepID=A0A0A9DZS8_ARUDO
MTLVYWLKVLVEISLRLIACCRRLSILWRRLYPFLVDMMIPF